VKHGRNDYNRIQDPAAEPGIYNFLAALAAAVESESEESILLVVEEHFGPGGRAATAPMVARVRAFAERAVLPDGASTPIGRDEPVFLIRAQDKAGPGAVRAWAEIAQVSGAAGCSPRMYQEALAVADNMERWADDHQPYKIPDLSDEGEDEPDIDPLQEHQDFEGCR
jgi:hypothetical protein